MLLRNSEMFWVRVSVARVELIDSPVKGMIESSSVKLKRAAKLWTGDRYQSVLPEKTRPFPSSGRTCE